MSTRNFTHNSNFFFSSNLFSEEETSYAIQECPLPGLSFSHIQTSARSVLGNLQGDTLTYNDLIINFIIDEELIVWKEIVNKMLLMRNPENNLGEQIEKYSYLEIHDDNSNVVLKLEFVGCMIESIDDLSYNTTSQDEIITCSITIKYDYYNIV
jgi:hypothetical protein